MYMMASNEIVVDYIVITIYDNSLGFPDQLIIIIDWKWIQNTRLWWTIQQ